MSVTAPEDAGAGDVEGPSARLRAIRLWCRRRVDQKVARALRIGTLRLGGRSHEEVRMEMGLTVEDYRRSRRWLNEAVARSVLSGGNVGDTLREHADLHVEAVLRYGLLKRQGLTRSVIRARIGCSEDECDSLDQWWRDALAATAPQR